MDLNTCPACKGSLTVVNDPTTGAVTWCQLPHPPHMAVYSPSTGMVPSNFAGFTLPNANATQTWPPIQTYGAPVTFSWSPR